MYDIFLLVKDGDNYLDLTERFPNIKVIYTDDRYLNSEVLTTILSKTLTKHFYVINNPNITINDFNFMYEVPEYDSEFVFRWVDNTIRLFNRKSVKRDIEKYIESSSECPYKTITDQIWSVINAGTSLYDIFVVTDDIRKFEYFSNRYPTAKPLIRKHNRVNFKLLRDILSEVKTNVFYLILDPMIEMDNFDFTFAPPEWDFEYMHTWNNDLNIRLMSTECVRENTIGYTDNKVASGKVKIKNDTDVIYHPRGFDVVFLSNNEPYADANYEELKKRVPSLKRVNGVKGIFEAHKEAAKISESHMVYVIDADAIVVDDFDFAFMPDISYQTHIHVWRSKNPINDLVYGYGGVKLFPTYMLRESSNWRIDFTTTIGDGLVVKEDISNITKFNYDEYTTWRSAFRECVKLGAKLIPNQKDDETNARLDIWCSVGADRKYGDYAIHGAIAGKNYGERHRTNREKMGLINDYVWLMGQFTRYYYKEGNTWQARWKLT